jgi:Flavin containing amine oxidoreductase
VTQDAPISIHLQAPKPRRTPRKDTRLYFAGEATHKADAYTVHGAYLSGDADQHCSHVCTAFAAAM